VGVCGVRGLWGGGSAGLEVHQCWGVCGVQRLQGQDCAQQLSGAGKVDGLWAGGEKRPQEQRVP
jgi:hypothetical protein